MSDFVVAIPLFDYEMAVQMYHLEYRSGDRMLGLQNDYQRMNDAFNAPGLEVLDRFGIEAFAGDKPLLIEATKFQLLAGMPLNIQVAPEKLIFLIHEDLTNDSDFVEKCLLLNETGYSFALTDYPKNENNPLLRAVNYVLLDAGDSKFQNKSLLLSRKHKRIKSIITQIPNRTDFKQLRNSKSLFGGSFYNEPITEGSVVLSPLKINALHLLYQVNNEDFDLADIVRIIERDPYLTISLLRFINSRASGLNRKVESIKQAVAILGQKEVRRWATIALSVSLGEDRPSEITRLSLMRAKFAENLACAFELGTFQSSLFLIGLFSLLDVILEQPMEKAIKEVSVNDQVSKALVRHEGNLYKVLELIYAYERADWDLTQIIMIQNNITTEAVSNAFLDALVWYKQLLESIDEESAPAGAPGLDGAAKELAAKLKK